jgi:hypothetical protein
MLEAITQSSLVFPFLSLLLHLHKLYWYDAKQLQVSCVHMEKVNIEFCRTHRKSKMQIQ